MLVSKEIDFVPSVAAIVMSAISRASKKLLIADCVHWVTNLCALSVMQKTGNILVRYKKKCVLRTVSLIPHSTGKS